MTISCRAIIFDLDGVLVDSDMAIVRGWREWADAQGVPFEEIASIYHGRPMIEVIQQVAPQLDAKAETEALGEKMAAQTDCLVAFEGAEVLLEKLPDDRWIIATSAGRRTARSRLSHTGLPVPDSFVSADDVENGKPDPEPYLLAAEALGVDARSCLVFEDAPAGVEAAQAAGAQVVGLSTTNPSEALSSATAVLSTLNDVSVEIDGTGEIWVQWKQESANEPASLH